MLRTNVLCLLSLLNLGQRLLDGAVWFVFQFRISNQPLIEGFFRPEEVNDSSTAAGEEDGGRGVGSDQFRLIESQVDA